MPVVNDYIEYTMPEDIKNLITDDFLKEFRNQLFRIHEYYSIDTFAEDGIPMNTSTGGWYAAFGKSCLLTHKEVLLDYWRTLPWYDSDIFDSQLADMLIERGFILGSLSKVIEQQLGIKEDDLRVCNDCGQMYSKDMVIKIPDTETDSIMSDYSFMSDYRCFHCQDIKDKNKYYENIRKELDEYETNHPIENEG